MIHSFLMIGQSNMAGRGLPGEVSPIVDPKIKMLRNGRWQTMAEPINYDRPFAGIGPAASFAQAWREWRPKEEIGLIPCADGGTCLDEWMPGQALFDHAVFQARLAARISCLDGVLWHQGETDCPLERAKTYGPKLARVMEAFRRELDLPEAPFLFGGLGDFLPRCRKDDFYINAPLVDQAVREYAGAHANCYYVSAGGLTPNEDLLHFSAASQRAFGRRYFQVFRDRRSLWEPSANF